MLVSFEQESTMGPKFAEIAFTPTVKKAQEQSGSRKNLIKPLCKPVQSCIERHTLVTIA